MWSVPQTLSPGTVAAQKTQKKKAKQTVLGEMESQVTCSGHVSDTAKSWEFNAVCFSSWMYSSLLWAGDSVFRVRPANNG